MKMWPVRPWQPVCTPPRRQGGPVPYARMIFFMWADALLPPPHMDDLCVRPFVHPFVRLSPPLPPDLQTDGRTHKSSICGGGKKVLAPLGADAPSPPHYIYPTTEMGHRVPKTTNAIASIFLSGIAPEGLMPYEIHMGQLVPSIRPYVHMSVPYMLPYRLTDRETVRGMEQVAL